MKQILNAYSYFSIFGTMLLLNAAPAVAATMIQGPPDGLNVNVVNPPTDPVPVTFDEPVAVTIQGQPPTPQPYQKNSVDVRDDAFQAHIDFPEVPEGFRLVIQDVAGAIAASGTPPTGDLPVVTSCSLGIFHGDSGNVNRILPTDRPFTYGTIQQQQYSDSVVMYAEAGEHAKVTCTLSGTAPHTSLAAFIGGILDPVPVDQ